MPEGKTDETFTDDDLPGLGLRIRAGGSKTWVYRYKLGNRFRRVTLGALAAMTSAQARKAAGDLHAMVRLGRDPAGERDEGRARAAETVAAALQAYLPYQQSRLRPRSYAEARATSTKALAATARDAAHCHRSSVRSPPASPPSPSRAAPYKQTERRASLRLFGWAMREGLADSKPGGRNR